MRWTETLIPTLRETPQEAEIVSHQLLLRAGLVRKLGGGVYTFLPLGLRALRKVERIVREEMDRAGALEMNLGVLSPAELWQQSGRYTTAAEVLFTLKDRSRREWVLGPTHEEVITSLVAGEINSYRQLPRNFYQITVKFRDEIRPRFGLMRAKEFTMKDAYSFDATDAGAEASYRKMFEAYTRIFRRCGLKAFPVEADTGVIGGKFSHEFMVPAETGENEIAYTEAGDYAANVEKAASRGPLVPTGTEGGGEVERFATPGVTTIEQLAAAPHGIAAERQIKTLVFLADRKPVLALVRGDDQLNEAKFAGALGTTLFRPATAEEIFALLGAHPGSLGAVAARLPAGFDAAVYADAALRGGAGLVTGANEDGFHVRHVDAARDLRVTAWTDLRTVKAGELDVAGGAPLRIRRGIEVGHLFKLGTKYSESMEAYFLDAQRERKPAVMGCYGIGVTRTLQAVIEQSNDANGIVWPVSVAPYDVEVLTISAQNPACVQAAEALCAQLAAAGVEVLYDDRDERPGVKFKDADLVGLPVRIGVGDRGLARGCVELKLRATGEMRDVPLEGAAEEIRRVVDGLRAGLEPYAAMARRFSVEKDTALLWWAAGLLALGLWHLRDGWFPPGSVLEKHPLGDPAHSYFYIYNKSVAVLAILGAGYCAFRHFFRK